VAKFGEGRPDGLGATFGQLLDKWLEESERMDLSPTTLRTYRAQVEQIIRPRLGKIPLTRLTPKHLDDLYRHMKEEGRSPKTIRNYHAIISSALHQGVRWEWVRENVAEKAKPPRVSQRRITAPSVDAVRSVIEAAEDRNPRLAPLLMLAALTGMRRGELCALRWTDVELERCELDVSKSVVEVPGGIAEKGTKTDRGRIMALDEVGMDLLARHRVKVDEWAAQAEICTGAGTLAQALDRQEVTSVGQLVPSAHLSGRSKLTSLRYSPVTPSSSSLVASAWPAWRAVSLIR